MNSAEKLVLISELVKLGIKHTSEKIVKIAKQADGKIVFLEEGKPGKRGSGLDYYTFWRNIKKTLPNGEFLKMKSPMLLWLL